MSVEHDSTKNQSPPNHCLHNNLEKCKMQKNLKTVALLRWKLPDIKVIIKWMKNGQWCLGSKVRLPWIQSLLTWLQDGHQPIKMWICGFFSKLHGKPGSKLR